MTQSTKKCPQCNTHKELVEFYKHRGCKDGVQSYCKICFKQRQSTPERKRHQRIYRFNSETSIKRRDYYRAWRLKTKYGITIDQYNQKLIDQNGLCAICEKSHSECMNGLYVDHDHRTNIARDLLCRECNTALGHLKEKPALFRKAADYLERHTILKIVKSEEA